VPGEVNCVFTKGLIPLVERDVGPEGVAAICRIAGRSREYLMADHNWIPLAAADEMVATCRRLTDEPDEERWARRYAESFMDWKPREERSYIGTYSMGIGHPRGAYQRAASIFGAQCRFVRLAVPELGRRHAVFQWTPLPGYRMPLWTCTWFKVEIERLPTNWGLPRAQVVEHTCAARGDDACRWDVRWQNPGLGAPFWVVTLAGLTGSALMLMAALGRGLDWSQLAVVPLPALAGAAMGYSLRESERRQHTQHLLDLQSEEIIYSNRELEKKFTELETRIEQLSLLTDLSAAVSGTLDPEKIYDQALDRLADRSGYQEVSLLLADRAGRTLRAHRQRAATPDTPPGPALTVALDAEASAIARTVLGGHPVLIRDARKDPDPACRVLARAGARSVVAAPLRVGERLVGLLAVTAPEPERFDHPDADLLVTVANHVALALDKAQSFQTIEEMSRGLEDTVRIRTEQLRTANEELRAAYRDLQATQAQLIQREKMASIGRLVAGVAHELNNPIGFISSNVTTLEDFVRRLRAMLESYQAVALPAPEQERLAARRAELKIDYALTYLDRMIAGIREGADRTRKIVGDLRVFTRAADDVWQPVDLHEEIESSLTLLGHLLRDRITVERRFGDIGPVECVRSQIDQVLLNLLANAAQAIVGPGTITIETRREGDMARVRIVDDGPGIPPEVLPRVFDPFFTTKPVGEGTGLGLSISYEIVKHHGGDIQAESPAGGGAVFTVRLPVSRRAGGG